jgi:hypothetical protein
LHKSFFESAIGVDLLPSTPTALHREHGKAHLLDQEFQQALFHGKELVGAMGRLSQTDDRGAPDDLLQRLYIVEWSLRVGRLERNGVLVDPGLDWS